MQLTVTIEVNGNRLSLKEPIASGSTIKAAARYGHGALYRLDGEGRRLISDDEIIELQESDRFEIVPLAVITIIIEDKKYETQEHVLTGSQIKELGKQPPANYLYQLVAEERILIEDDQKVHLRDGDAFITQPQCGHAS